MKYLCFVSMGSDPLLSHRTAKKRPKYPLLIYNEFLDNSLKGKGIQAMAHCNTVFLQLLKTVGRHEFEAIASLHHQGQRLRKTRAAGHSLLPWHLHS